MKPTFTYTGQPGQGFGWGTANTYLQRELSAIFPPGDDAVMQPLADHDLTPTSPLSGKRLNFGYSFFESPLGSKAVENADKFDVVFVGSEWCRERLMDAGIYNGRTLIQGVDTEIFYPRPRTGDKRFTVFSGGKFEYRKGQDLVIAAFREFLKTEPDALLVANWWNPWPQLIGTMAESKHMIWPLRKHYENQIQFFYDLLTENGIPPENFSIIDRVSHETLSEIMAQTDVGLFPNRCEGGTNLVLMEYAACGKPIVANVATGHRDMRHFIDVDIPCGLDEKGWAKQDVQWVTEGLKKAIWMRRNIVTIRDHERAKELISWKNTAATVAKAVEDLCQ